MKIRLFARLLLLTVLALSSCGRKAPAPTHPRAAAQDAASPAGQPGPADLPACPEFIASEDVQGHPQAGSAVLFSRQTVNSVLDYYTTQLAADGWVLGSALQQGKAHHLQFARGRRFLRLQIEPSAGPGATRILLAWKHPPGQPEADDAYAPESREDDPEHLNESSVEW